MGWGDGLTRSPSHRPSPQASREKINRFEVFQNHELFKSSDQRHQSGQHLCDHRARLHDGLRHCKDAELRPWRCHHGRRLYVLLRNRLPWLAVDRGRCAGGRCMYPAGRCHRAVGLQTAAAGACTCRADHCDRRFLLPAKCGAADLGLEHKELYLGRRRQPDLAV